MNVVRDSGVPKLQWTPELVNKFWNGIAQTRLDEISFGKIAGPELLNIVEPYLQPSGTHLDYGAGSGHIVRLLVERGYRTAGYDPSAGRQELLSAQVRDLPQFLGAVGPQSGQVFDVVFLIEVIEHILDADFDAAMERLRGFVRPSGRIIVSTPNSEDLDLGNAYCPVSDVQFHRWQHVRAFTPEQLEQTLQRYGFRRVFLGLMDFSDDWPVYEAFKNAVQQEKLIREHLKSRPDGAQLERQFRSLQETLGEFPTHQVDLAIRRLTSRRTRGLFGWIDSVLFHKQTNMELVSLLGSISQFCKKLEMQAGGALKLLADPRLGHSAERAPRPAAARYDLRRGRESTIVYVGERFR